MRPETTMNAKGKGDINVLLDEWLRVYAEILEENHDKEEIIDMLSERIRRAFKLLSEGKTDDDPSLDGDFPLGNERDMSFAGEYFDIYDLAVIQVGFPWYADCTKDKELVDITDIRKGFVQEMYGDYAEAVHYYKKVSEKSMLGDRIEYARRMNRQQGEVFYQKAQKLISEGIYSNVYYYLWRAADTGHLEALTEQALADAYGFYGVGYDLEQAKILMRKAAEGGDEHAKLLIAEGFGEKTHRDILLDKIEDGDTNALFEMAMYCTENDEIDEAEEWLTKALEEEVPDALLYVAELYMDESNEEMFDLELAAEYLYKAAMGSSTEAMLMCAQFMEQASSVREQGDIIISLYEQAAEQGSIEAVERLYQIYTNGTIFTEPDETKSSYYAFISSRYRD